MQKVTKLLLFHVHVEPLKSRNSFEDLLTSNRRARQFSCPRLYLIYSRDNMNWKSLLTLKPIWLSQTTTLVITSLWQVLRDEGNVIFPVDTRYESYKVNKTSASAILSTMLVYQRSRLTTRPFLYKIGWRRTNRIVN